MKLELWVGFIIAYSVISLIPGPSVLFVTGQALIRGRTASFFCILGDVLGDITLMALSFLGIGAVLAVSAELFQLVKWCGVCYMAYLGCSQVYEARKTKTLRLPETRPVSYSASIRNGFLVAVFNPKAIIFYMAFLTQFMDPNSDALPQFLILMATSTVIVTIILSGYALAASQAREIFQSNSARRGFSYIGGAGLIGGSVYVATSR